MYLEEKERELVCFDLDRKLDIEREKKLSRKKGNGKVDK